MGRRPGACGGRGNPTATSRRSKTRSPELRPPNDPDQNKASGRLSWVMATTLPSCGCAMGLAAPSNTRLFHHQGHAFVSCEFGRIRSLSASPEKNPAATKEEND